MDSSRIISEFGHRYIGVKEGVETSNENLQIIRIREDFRNFTAKDDVGKLRAEPALVYREERGARSLSLPSLEET